jgi:hypothetical protein
MKYLNKYGKAIEYNKPIQPTQKTARLMEVVMSNHRSEHRGLLKKEKGPGQVFDL